MKTNLSLILLCLAWLAACSPAVTNVGPVTIDPWIATQSKLVALTKQPMLTVQSQTETARSPKNDATLTAIMAGKYAMRTEYSAALAALSPTPTFPPGAAYCRPVDLKAKPWGPDALGFGEVGLGGLLKNTGKTPCLLGSLPQVVLSTRDGRPLDVDYNMQEPIASSTPGTPQADQTSEETIGLLPGQAANLIIMWGNWCGTAIANGVVIQLTLTGNTGRLDIPTTIEAGGRCDGSSDRSVVSVDTLYIEQP
jgi:hypothetical protein